MSESLLLNLSSSLAQELQIAWIEVQTRPKQAVVLAKSVLAKAIAQDDKQIQAHSLSILCLGHYTDRHYEEALQCGLEAHRLYAEHERSDIFVSLLNTLGSLYFRFGNYSEALDYFQRQEAFGRNHNNRLEVAKALIGQASVHAELEDHERALADERHALQLNIELDNLRGIIICYNNISHTLCMMERHEEAVEAAEAGLDHCRPEGDEQDRLRGTLYVSLSLPLIALNRFDEVDEVYQSALDIAGRLEDRQMQAHLTAIRGRYFSAKQAYKAARLYFEQAIEQSKAIGTRKRTLAIYEQLIEVLKADGDFESAVGVHEQLLKLQRELFNEQVASSTRNLEIAHHTAMSQQKVALAEQYSAELEIEVTARTQQLRNVMEHTPIVFFRADESGNFLYMEGQVKQIAELEPEEILADSELYFSRIHKEDKAKVWDIVQKAVAERAQFQISHRLVMPDGRIKWVEVIIKPTELPDGTLVGNGVAIEQTMRRKAEEEVQALSQRLSLALESAQIGVWEWSKTTDKLIWDERMFSIFGVDRADFQGHFSDFAQLVVPEDFEVIQRSLNEQMHQTVTNEFRVVRPNGEMVYIQSFMDATWDGAGNLVGLVGLNIDITERKRAEEGLTTKHTQLHALLNNIAHPAWMKDETGRFIAVNEPYARSFGGRVEEWIGNTGFEFYPVEDAELFQQTEAKIMETGETWFKGVN